MHRRKYGKGECAAYVILSLVSFCVLMTRRAVRGICVLIVHPIDDCSLFWWDSRELMLHDNVGLLKRVAQFCFQHHAKRAWHMMKDAEKRSLREGTPSEPNSEADLPPQPQHFCSMLRKIIRNSNTYRSLWAFALPFDNENNAACEQPFIKNSISFEGLFFIHSPSVIHPFLGRGRRTPISRWSLNCRHSKTTCFVATALFQTTRTSKTLSFWTYRRKVLWRDVVHLWLECSVYCITAIFVQKPLSKCRLRRFVCIVTDFKAVPTSSVKLQVRVAAVQKLLRQPRNHTTGRRHWLKLLFNLMPTKFKLLITFWISSTVHAIKFAWKKNITNRRRPEIHAHFRLFS